MKRGYSVGVRRQKELPTAGAGLGGRQPPPLPPPAPSWPWRGSTAGWEYGYPEGGYSERSGGSGGGSGGGTAAEAAAAAELATAHAP